MFFRGTCAIISVEETFEMRFDPVCSATSKVKVLLHLQYLPR